jgi:NTE family protein
MTRRAMNLALQGGGAHGAFTWGVLDALLEDGRIEPEALSGASAGAMNAVVLAHGWLEDGRDGARAALRAFWTALADTMPVDLTRRDADGAVRVAPALTLWLRWSRHLAPAQSNPFDLNPLRELLARQVDFERLRARSPLKLYVAATQASSGRLRVFARHELSVDVLLASACLPTLFRAPRIGGQAYWDGGYSANPAVFPLLAPGHAPDTLLVLLSPLDSAFGPEDETAEGLQARIAEIAFTAAFRREMQGLARDRAESARRWWPPRRWQAPAARTRFHLIEAGPALAHFAAETRAAVSRSLFEALHALGRAEGRRWIERHLGDVGRRDSVDLQARFA